MPEDNISFPSMQDLTSPDAPNHLQQHLTALAKKWYVSHFWSHTAVSLSTGHYARLHSISSSEAGAFLRALPGVAQFTSQEFSTACTFRLGLPFPFIDRGLTCSCGQLVLERGQHLHCCSRGNERHSRHDDICDILADLSRRAGIRTTREPRNCFQGSRSHSRPDMLLIQPLLQADDGKNLVTDVQITHPETSSQADSASAGKGVAARLAEQAKTRFYRDKTAVANLSFTPLVLETYGRWGDQLKDFVDKLVNKIYRLEDGRVPHHAIADYYRKRISASLQKGNARLLLQRVQRINLTASYKTGPSFRLDVFQRHQPHLIPVHTRAWVT